MNSVVMVGRLTRDPELRFIAGSGKAVATFAIAVDRPFAKEKTADFFNIVVWGKPAENAANYLSKGSQVAVKGYLTSRSYEDKEHIKRYVTEIVADNVEYIRSGERKQSEIEQGHADAGRDFSSEGFSTVEDDDIDEIPF